DLHILARLPLLLHDALAIFVDLALLDVRVARRVLHGDDHDVTHPRVATLGAAEHTDAQDLLGTRVLGVLESRLLLDHGSPDQVFSMCAGFRPDTRGHAARLRGR